LVCSCFFVITACEVLEANLRTLHETDPALLLVTLLVDGCML